MGAEFWLLAEGTFDAYLAGESKQGGVRLLVAEHRDWLNENSMFGDGEGDYMREPAPIHNTCAENHPGLCSTRHAAINTTVKYLASRLCAFD